MISIGTQTDLTWLTGFEPTTTANVPSQSKRHWTLWFDGGSRGNPGIAGSGAVCRDSNTNEKIFEVHEGFLRATNNVAEWMGLLIGLRQISKCVDKDIEMNTIHLDIYGDSNLVIKQVNEEWQVRNPQLQRLFQGAQELLMCLNGWSATHIYRKDNSEADKLANVAMDVLINHKS